MDSQQSFERRISDADNPLLRGTAKDAFEAMRTLRTIGTPDYRPAAAEYPRSPFGQALQEIARVAKADVGLEVAFAESTTGTTTPTRAGVTGQVAQPARRSRQRHRGAGRGPRRAHGRHRAS